MLLIDSKETKHSPLLNRKKRMGNISAKLKKRNFHAIRRLFSKGKLAVHTFWY